MTVSTATRKQQFTLDGIEDEFTFTFRALTTAPSDIKCKKTASGVETALTYTTQYTVAINSDGIGGTVTLVNPAAIGSGTLTVYRETTNQQNSDYDDYNQFPADTLETDLDIRTLISQEQGEDKDRSLRLPISVTGVDAELPVPAANKVLGWNAAATGLENKVAIDADVAAAAAASATASSSYSTIALASKIAAELAETNAEAAAASIPATPFTPQNGGTGITNNSNSTLTISGNYSLRFNISGNTNITLPTSGTIGIGDVSYADTRIAVGTFTRDISVDGAQDVTVSAFNPKNVLFFFTIDSTSQIGQGLDNGTTRWVLVNKNGASANTSYTSTSYSIVVWVDGTNYVTAVAAMGTNKFTVTWTKASSPTGTVTVNWIAYR